MTRISDSARHHIFSVARHVTLSLALLLVACGGQGDDGDDEGIRDMVVSLPDPDFGYQVATEPFVVDPGEEVEMCDVVRVSAADSEQLAWFNNFESLTSEGTHHMNVWAGRFSVGDAISEGGSKLLLQGHDVGQYDCEELGGMMEQGAQVFYPSQRPHQRGGFPEGVGYPIPVPMVFVMNHHYINTTDRPVRVNAVLNMHRVAEDDVEHVAGFVWGRDPEIELPARSRKIEGGFCRFTRDLNMVAISSHTHERGACFTMNLYDGQQDQLEEEPFFVNQDWEAPPIQFMTKQDWTGGAAVPMAEGDGISFGCHYVNREDRTVEDGPSARDEMCIFVALVYPAEVSKDEVRSLLTDPSFESFQAFQDGTMLPCEFDETGPTPWTELGETRPLSSTPPDVCAAPQPRY